MSLLKIPYRISTFRTTIEEGYVYVDKIRYIRILDLFNRIIAKKGSFNLKPDKIREAMREIGYE
ncbi:MAG TPA: hypothetical protein PK024_06110 [Methanospirillum sp.]|uniref:hypothetical protein n=1 Tax=Methanospirillum sp. TaxID=45200 RepID=UPI002D1C8279|nr:hypothetical protein [Methanospirillum sp.]HOJ96396.1 hypothetical protein [Methanospirillum sp.]HOL41022.1 hypothetical protein [Methanospirillum sp.]HPP77463.1 hypothetical protein [Methanospirillum sp.]